MKNRKRETCTSGSVIDEDGNILIYSAEEQTLAAELLDEFGKTLMPILNNAGVTPVKPKVHPVHNVIEG
jgi:hypothetical protein